MDIPAGVALALAAHRTREKRMQAVLRAYQERAALMMQRAWRRRRLRKRRAPNQKLVVRAIPDFTASEPTDLPGFSVGMMIVVTDKQGGGDWWKGYLSANPQKQARRVSFQLRRGGRGRSRESGRE